MIVGVLKKDPEAQIPQKAHAMDAAYDIYANDNVELLPQDEPILVPTGVVLALPNGYAGLILPRSGLAGKYGVTVANSPGLVDPGYRGEVFVALVNHNPVRTHLVKKGDRIAQLLIVPFANSHLTEIPDEEKLNVYFPIGERGFGGFGSSGK
jgi:dUTP pyrophosphatase